MNVLHYYAVPDLRRRDRRFLCKLAHIEVARHLSSLTRYANSQSSTSEMYFHVDYTSFPPTLMMLRVDELVADSARPGHLKELLNIWQGRRTGGDVTPSILRISLSGSTVKDLYCIADIGQLAEGQSDLLPSASVSLARQPCFGHDEKLLEVTFDEVDEVCSRIYTAANRARCQLWPGRMMEDAVVGYLAEAGQRRVVPACYY